MYQVRNAARSEFVRIRQHDYHLNVWGEPAPGRPPLVLLHGWMDVGASWQFMVDALTDERWVLAPDWRGFGRTSGPPVDSYWMPDYLGDLDFLLDRHAPDAAVDLVGHSMGGNIAMLYAGVRPERVRRLVNLEGFGMPETRPAQAPVRYAQWLDELKRLERGELDLNSYADAGGVAERLMKTNPRLPRDKADWLARRWAREDPGDGRWRILGAPAHKVRNANLYQVPETLAIFERIAAPTLVIEAQSDSLGRWWKRDYTLEQFHERIAKVPDLEIASVAEAGHMLHHDQPEALARLVEDFLQRPQQPPRARQ